MGRQKVDHARTLLSTIMSNTRACESVWAQIAEEVWLVAELQKYTSLVVVESWAIQSELTGA